jgi:predicted nucleotide-binding protein
MWRGLAKELAQRLRQRNQLVRSRNEKPHVFIGSSAESIAVANKIQSGLAHDPFIVQVWTNHVFGASEFSLESLESVVETADFAVLVFSPDDQLIVREGGVFCAKR